MTPAENVLRHLEQGTLIRNAWGDGHERACLLAAMHPPCATHYESACPAEVMPAWLAYLTPKIDDRGTREAWPAMVRRYADLASRWHVLDAAAWERARLGCLIAILVEARSHVRPDRTQALTAIDGVAGWLKRGAPKDECVGVRKAAADAAHAARADAYAYADAAAADAAAAAADAAHAAAAAAHAAHAAAYADADAYAAAYAAAAAAYAAAHAAWDRMTVGIFDAIEREIGK